ncbi:hypothetical protein V6N12_020878 [Hibiscus sabdariffa]|uniref:Uncharacterized protein n=1 Tax=Hibiscus sabdariffa TaxID=183260 RepID=A0ABR2CZG5_9ROSI
MESEWMDTLVGKQQKKNGSNGAECFWCSRHGSHIASNLRRLRRMTAAIDLKGKGKERTSQAPQVQDVNKGNRYATRRALLITSGMLPVRWCSSPHTHSHPSMPPQTLLS